MKFGKVENPGSLDLSLPADHASTIQVLQSGGYVEKKPKIYIGCPRWGKADLKDFYPKGTRDELTYYSSQFNSIELNAFYYRIFPTVVVDKWYSRSDPDFVFFPKVPQLISQFRRLKNCENELNDYLVSISHFKEKLGMVFLQMNDNYNPSNFNDLAAFIEQWPQDLALSVELRNNGWYNDPTVSNRLYALLEENKVCHTITDTAGRRDIMHMRLTNNQCFVRFTGANHPSDVDRLDEWFERLTQWRDQGIEQINFFIHQTIEKDLQMLSARLITKINEGWGYDMHVPGSEKQLSLF